MKRNGYIRYTVLSVCMLLSFIIASIPRLLPDFFDCYPVVLIPFIAAIALFEKEIAAGYFGLFAGMLLDLYSVNGGIFSTVTLCILAFLAGLIARHFFVENFYSALAVTTAIAFLHQTVYWMVYYLFRGKDGIFFAYYRQILPTVLYTVVFIVIFYPLVKWICIKHQQD
ncbi:MAG: hypothetical protein IJ462_00340 [Clostridia bacterium]|nr:hypothetical protein [Clostridia bacterium]